MSRSDRSAAEVFLPQHSKPGFGENGLPEVIVLNTEREGGMALGLGKKRVDEMDIRLCFEERAKAVGHLLGTVAQRHDEDVTRVERDPLLNKKRLDGVGITHDEAHDGVVD